ncbi:MAG: hypothetical protein AAF234_16835, partial [Pseudomonadota bacterium]
SFTVRSAASVWRSGVCLILHSYLVKMSQKLSLMQSAQLIPWALTGNRREARAQRKRAFRAWMAVVEEMGSSPSQ